MSKTNTAKKRNDSSNELSSFWTPFYRRTRVLHKSPKRCRMRGQVNTIFSMSRLLRGRGGGFNRFAVSVLTALIFFSASTCFSAQTQVLHSHVPAVVSKLQPLNRLLATKRLNLAIALHLRNRESLTNLLQNIYNPASPNFHRYLTPQQFANQFGPTEQDYQAVKDFAQVHRLSVTETHANRTLLGVSGSVR